MPLFATSCKVVFLACYGYQVTTNLGIKTKAREPERAVNQAATAQQKAAVNVEVGAPRASCLEQYSLTFHEERLGMVLQDAPGVCP